jgi:hypothetical protein
MQVKEIKIIFKSLRSIAKYIDDDKTRCRIVQLYMMLNDSTKKHNTTTDQMMLRNNMDVLKEPLIKGLLIIADKKAKADNAKNSNKDIKEIFKLAERLDFTD